MIGLRFAMRATVFTDDEIITRNGRSHFTLLIFRMFCDEVVEAGNGRFLSRRFVREEVYEAKQLAQRLIHTVRVREIFTDIGR